jgi:hypothetical protein
VSVFSGEAILNLQFQKISIVMAGLVPAISLRGGCALVIGIAGTSPAMMAERARRYFSIAAFLM